MTKRDEPLGPWPAVAYDADGNVAARGTAIEERGGWRFVPRGPLQHNVPQDWTIRIEAPGQPVIGPFTLAGHPVDSIEEIQVKREVTELERAVARAICLHHGVNPDALEPHSSSWLDEDERPTDGTFDGEPAHFLWREQVDLARAVIAEIERHRISR